MLGAKIYQFEVPVCRGFKSTILNDQLCYEVDLNSFSNKSNIQKELKLGFNFLMDYNEDRQVLFDKSTSKKKLWLARSVVESDESQEAFVYLDTIGKRSDLNTAIF